MYHSGRSEEVQHRSEQGAEGVTETGENPTEESSRSTKHCILHMQTHLTLLITEKFVLLQLNELSIDQTIVNILHN